MKGQPGRKARDFLKENSTELFGLKLCCQTLGNQVITRIVLRRETRYVYLSIGKRILIHEGLFIRLDQGYLILLSILLPTY